VVGWLGGVVAAGFFGGRFLGEEVFEALADVFVPALGAIEAALTGGVVEVEEQQELAEFALQSHGSPASMLRRAGRRGSEFDHSRM